jgi:hypothetical protein
MVLQSFFRTDRNLRGESITLCKDRCGDHRRISRVNQTLPADDDEATVAFRIALRFLHTIDVSAPHRPLSFFRTIPYWSLQLKTVFSFSVEPTRVPINDFKIPGVA